MKSKISILSVLIALVCCFAFAFAACSGNGNASVSNGKTDEVTVTFDANGGEFPNGETVLTKKVTGGGVLTAPDNPERTGYSFGGWSRNRNGGTLWAFATDKANADMTLYAAWEIKTAAVLGVSGGSIDGKNIFMLVEQGTEMVSLSDKITVSEGSVWNMYADASGQTLIPTKAASGLNDGNNVYYILVSSSDGSQSELYTLTIHRSYIVNITYKDGEGNVLETQTALTGKAFSLDYEPDIEGYVFVGWKDSEGQTVEQFVPYAPAEFTAETRAEKYTVTLDAKGGDLSENSASVTYGENFQLPVPERDGYTFLGWSYNGEMQTDKEGRGLAKWTNAENRKFTAEWENDALLPFTYIGSGNRITITGIKEEYLSATELVVPSEVVLIEEGAFKGLGNLTQYTAPFVGKSSTENNQLGFVFGKEPFEGTVPVVQHERVSSNSIPADVTYYIPATLAKVTISGGETCESFYNCTMLEEAVFTSPIMQVSPYLFYKCSSLKLFNVPENTDTIGSYAFYETGIPEMTLPDQIKYIGEYAFYNCDSLETFTGESVVTLGDFALSSCSILKKATFGESLYSIGERAIASCNEFAEITLGSSLSQVKSLAFIYDSNLSKVNYSGTLDDWCGITFADRVANPLWASGKLYIGGAAATEGSVTVNAQKINSFVFEGVSDMTELIVGKGVTEIAQSAFNGIIGIEKITLPFVGGKIPAEKTARYPVGYIFGTDNVDGSSATEQKYLNAQDAVTTQTYYIPDSLAEITITGGAIPYGAFYGMASLEKLTIEGDAAAIGAYACYNCTALGTLILSDGVTDIGERAFYDCILNDFELGSDLNSIGAYAFYRCEGIKEINIPDGINAIEMNAFNGCNGVGSLFTGNNVIEIKEGAFGGLTSLNEAQFGSSLKTIGKSALSGCGLTELVIPATVTNIGQYAVSGCNSLEDLTLPFVGETASDTTHNTASWLFYDVPASLTKITVTGGTIGERAFYEYAELTSVTLSATRIGSSAFYGCTSLGEVILNEGVVGLGIDAFRGCTSLTEITLPKSIKSVSGGAFDGTGLDKVIYSGTIADWCGIQFATVQASGTSNFSSPAQYTDNIFIDGKKALDGTIDVPAEVTTISAGAFAFCKNLVGVNFAERGDDWLLINDGAFYESGLQSITLDFPTLLSGEKAFMNCKSLLSADLSGCTQIWKNNVLYGCDALESLTVPFMGASENSADNCFLGYLFGGKQASNNSTYVPQSLKEVTFNGSKLKSSYFYGCNYIEKLVFGANLTEIGSSLFGGSGMSALTGIWFNDPVGWTAGTNKIDAETLSDPAQALTLLTDTYWNQTWKKTAA